MGIGEATIAFIVIGLPTMMIAFRRSATLARKFHTGSMWR